LVAFVTETSFRDAPVNGDLAVREVEVVPFELRAMHRECAGRARAVEMPRHRDLAEKLRELLKVAGVRRPKLFISDKTRINLRFHDLRASAVTWMTVRGNSPAPVMKSRGQEDWETLKSTSAKPRH
jgi:hypothetical protein